MSNITSLMKDLENSALRHIVVIDDMSLSLLSMLHKSSDFWRCRRFIIAVIANTKSQTVQKELSRAVHVGDSLEYLNEDALASSILIINKQTEIEIIDNYKSKASLVYDIDVIEDDINYEVHTNEKEGVSLVSNFVDEMGVEERYMNYADTEYSKVSALYNREILTGLKFIDEFQNAVRITSGIEGKNEHIGRSTLLLSVNNSYSYIANEFIENTRYKYWHALVDDLFVKSCMTTRIKGAFCNYELATNKCIDINENTLNKRLIDLSNDITNMFCDDIKVMHKSIITAKDAGEFKNVNEVVLSNGTIFSAMRSNIIIPMKSSFEPDGRLRIHAATREFLMDLEKLFNYIRDRDTKYVIDSKKELECAEEFQKTKDIRLKYFNVSFLKKGAIRINFVNHEMFCKWNIVVGKILGFIPNNIEDVDYDGSSDESLAVRGVVSKDMFEYVKLHAAFYNNIPNIFLKYNFSLLN